MADIIMQKDKTSYGHLTRERITGPYLKALVLDTIAQNVSPAYRSRLQLHEAAHFLVAYLMGILPKGYTLSSMDAYRKYGALNIQAGEVWYHPTVQ